MTSNRVTGFITLATGLAVLVLLAFHPGGHAHDFEGLLREEAAGRAISAVVHGGVIVILAIQLACYGVLAGRLGWKPLAVAGLAFFAVGAGLQMASVLVDGLIIPQLAERYVAATPDRIPFARSLFALCTVAIQFLMPMGLFFQGAAVTAWGGAMARPVRGAGIVAAIVGLMVMTAAIAFYVTGQPYLALLAISLLAAWAILAGVAQVRQWI